REEKHGFETSSTFSGSSNLCYFEVEALNADGEVLGRSETLRTSTCLIKKVYLPYLVGSNG
ncbi:MAG: hypothetical protein AAF633_12940, partial [Chloroflexota bacterium]